MMPTALLITDVQHALCSGECEAFESERVIDCINVVSRKARAAGATRRALALGYPVTLLSDAHSTIDNSVLSAAQITAHHNETLSNITSFGPRVRAVPSHEVTIDA